jgi:hypothetical protein
MALNTKPYNDPSQTLALVCGESGVGKTDFILRHCKGPVGYLWFDNRSKKNLNRIRAEGKKKVYDESYHMPTEKLSPADAIRHAKEIQESVITNIKWFTKNGIDTIGIDTVTECNAIFKFAYDGTLELTKEGAFGKDIAYQKAQWQRIFDIVRGSNCNLICTARAKEIWKTKEVNGKEIRSATGVNTYRAPEEVNELSDWSVELRLAENEIGRRMPKFIIDVIKSGEDLQLYGKRYKEKDWQDLGLNPWQFLRMELQGIFE